MTKEHKLNSVLKALADPTRREIFHLLIITSASLSLTQITEKFEITRQGLTKHINILEKAGLVTSTELGRERFCVANPTPLHQIQNWLNVYNKFWDTKLQSLENYLGSKNPK